MESNILEYFKAISNREKNIHDERFVANLEFRSQSDILTNSENEILKSLENLRHEYFFLYFESP